MKRIPPCIFTEEFDREAVRLMTEQSLTMAEAVRKVGISAKLLRTWWEQLDR